MSTKQNVVPTERSLRTIASLDASPELRQHYLHNLVHELATPLTPLLGYLTLFERGSLGELTPLQARCLGSMRHAATRLHRVLDDLGHLLQMEAGTYRLQPEPIALRELVERALEETAAQASEQQLDVIREVSAEGQILGDETRLRIALQHLLWNGIKFNTAGGKLMVRTSVVEEEGARVARIEVFDTGIGIKAEDLERVFEPFYQSDHGSTRRFEGAGLGLSFVHWIVGLHGGRIELQSPPSEQPKKHFFRGVRALVTLPLV
jgi:two-component system, NarL family, sensor histidine kinase BarA